MTLKYELREGLRLHPDEWPRYAIYADALEEQGEMDLAFAYRWMSKKQRKPYYRTGARVRKRWAWNWVELQTDNRGRADGVEFVITSMLSRPLRLAMAQYNIFKADSLIYSTEDEAIGNLAEGLKTLREVF